MNLIIGEQIFVTDENLSGKVKSFTEKEVTLECEYGFDYIFPIDKVYKLNEDGKVENKTIPQKIELKLSKKNKSKGVFSLRFNVNNPVFDLHIETLDPTKLKLPFFEILQFQMAVVEEILFQANRKRVRKIVLVHGVGEGKLRSSIRAYLKSGHPEVEYLDASYQKYGAGATELIIHQFDSID